MCDKHKDDYLIVGTTKKMATYVYRQFRDYIVKHNINVAFNNKSQTLLISSNDFHGEIRFVSERDFLVASVGFHGWTLDGYDLEWWLDAAEEYEREDEL
mgnify:CR=1 FL=1